MYIYIYIYIYLYIYYICHIYILMKKVIILRKIDVKVKSYEVFLLDKILRPSRGLRHWRSEFSYR